jgi:putative hydrolase of HD superfamily
MRIKAPPPISHLQGEQVGPLVQTYFELNHLKQLYRQGWLARGVPVERCESVAEHTFGVALLAWFLVDAHLPTVDRDKVLRMALIHDLGEIYAGDLTPRHQVSASEKRRLERESVTQVLARLPQGATYVALWEEYEEGSCPEAQFVRQVDRLEMALQAAVYERQGLIDPSEFYASVAGALSMPALQAAFGELEKLGDARAAADPSS